MEEEKLNQVKLDTELRKERAELDKKATNQEIVRRNIDIHMELEELHHQ